MSKAFHFPLQKVLNLREHKEEQKSIELGKAKAEMNKIQKKLDDLHVKKNDFLQDENRSQSRSTNLNSLRIKSGYMQQMNTSIEQNNVAMRDKKKKVKQRRDDLLVAVKDKKIVEKLKERKQEEHKMHVHKADAKRDDDVAIRTVNQNRQN